MQNLPYKFTVFTTNSKNCSIHQYLPESAFLHIQLKIENEDDNPPQFIQKGPLVGGIWDDITANQTILYFDAFDLDGNDTFSIEITKFTFEAVPQPVIDHEEKVKVEYEEHDDHFADKEFFSVVKLKGTKYALKTSKIMPFF